MRLVFLRWTWSFEWTGGFVLCFLKLRNEPLEFEQKEGITCYVLQFFLAIEPSNYFCDYLDPMVSETANRLPVANRIRLQINDQGPLLVNGEPNTEEVVEISEFSPLEGH